MAKTIVGLFDSRETAQRVVNDLVQAGCDRADIDISAAADTAGESQKREEKEGGFFSWLFGGEDDDRYTYEEGTRRGRTAVAVDAATEDDEKICAIMNRHNPLDINAESERWRQEGWTGAAAAAPARGESIPVIQENVEVGKRAVERGGLRIYSRVVERPVREQVSLTDEEVSVERRPADRPLKAGEEAFQERSMEMRETKEEPVVSKSARVVEEVGLSKERRERKEEVEDTERHTEVEVEHLQSPRSPDQTHHRP